MLAGSNRGLILLLCLNAVLLTAVVGSYVGTPQAHAQQQGQAPQYVLIPGNLRTDEQLVWIIDIANWRLTNCLYNKHSGDIEFADVIDMEADFARPLVTEESPGEQSSRPPVQTLPRR